MFTGKLINVFHFHEKKLELRIYFEIRFFIALVFMDEDYFANVKSKQEVCFFKTIFNSIYVIFAG